MASRRVPHRGRHAEAEQGDQGQVEHRTGGGAQHGPGPGQRRVAVRRVEAAAGQDEPPGQQRAEHGDGPGREHQAADDDRLGGQDGPPARHGGQRDPDHAGAVLAADGQHGEDGDDRLAQVDPGQADLGRVQAQPPAGTRAGGRHGAHGHGQYDGGKKHPAGARHGAQLRPLRAQAWLVRPRERVATLRRSCVRLRSRRRPGPGPARRRRTARRVRPMAPAGSSRSPACRRRLPGGTAAGSAERRRLRPG